MHFLIEFLPLASAAQSLYSETYAWSLDHAKTADIEPHLTIIQRTFIIQFELELEIRQGWSWQACI